MNPNKKLLNPKSSQAQASPWLLCPSKSFPGKFYYFNGSTGETAWCLSETDKNSKKGSIHRVTDKAHTYPEPFEPPIDDSTNTTNSFSSLKNTGTDYRPDAYVRPSPVFGQAVFPKYVPPDIFSPKFVWALTPMYVPSQLPHRQMLDQITQTYEPEQPRFAQSVPLNSRFQTLKRPTFTTEAFQFQTSSPFQHFKEKPMFEQASNFKTTKEPTFGKPAMKDEACQTFVPIKTRRSRTQSESDSTPKSALKPSRSVENLTLLTKDVETSTLSPPKKVDNGNDKLSELDKNDLRFKLVAKKKKVESDSTVGSEKSTDQSKPPQKPEGAKKHVTFDLQEPGVSGSSPDDVQEMEQETEQVERRRGRLQFSSASCRGFMKRRHKAGFMKRRQSNARTNSPSTEAAHPCYVVADTETLLSEWQCIEDMVKNDPSSRLLVPYTVFTELENRSRVDGAILARQALRKVAQENVVVQSEPDSELSSEDSILECCWSVLQEDCHVILVTNNKNLLNKAKSIDIECCTADEIKMRNKIDSGPKFDLAKLKIIVENDNKKSIVVENDQKKSENLFMQNLKDINGLSLRPNGFALRQSKLDTCNLETVDNNLNNRIDTGDKLINLTRPKNKIENMVLNSEITKVKNQIVNLRITGNSPTKNRTRQISKNVFWNAGLETIDTDPSIDGLEKNNKQILNEKHNVNKINQNTIIKPRHVELFDEIDLDIRKLDMTENNQEKRRDNIKVSGITKLDNNFNIDENLERFHAKNNVMENRVKSRLEEWVCRLNQTMEGVLTDLLLNEKAKIKKMMPPWNLFEALQVTGETYKKQPNIKTIVDTFSIALLSCSSNNGKLKKDIKPNDFMKLIGFSVILIENLKEIVNCKELNEAEEMLEELMKNIEDPKTDIDLSLEKVNTPIFIRSDISDVETLIGYRKSRTEVMEYLKKHFPAWQSETDTETVNDKIDKEPNILITCGKNLNTLKINNSKSITVDDKIDKTITQTNENNDAANNQPKVIRNVKIIDAFEERFKKRAELNLDELDYEDNETVFTVSDEVEVKSEILDDTEYDCVLDDLSVSESVDTECVRAYPLVKIFLVKLQTTLKNIYHFVNTCIQEYQQGMPVHKKDSMRLKTEISRQYLMKIAERLKNIIARESSDGVTLKHLLIKAGDYAEDDTTMTNYKQIVQKYLEQAEILEEVLDHMLSLFNSATLKESDTTYCPSFSTTSPILRTRLRNNTQLPNSSLNHS